VNGIRLYHEIYGQTHHRDRLDWLIVLYAKY